VLSWCSPKRTDSASRPCRAYVEAYQEAREEAEEGDPPSLAVFSGCAYHDWKHRRSAVEGCWSQRLPPWLGVEGGGLGVLRHPSAQPQTKRVRHPQHGCQLRVTRIAERLVEGRPR